MIPSARADVHVTYRRMLIAEPGRDHPGAVPNGLTASAPGAAVILTGIHTGVVDVTVRLADTPPPADPGWDETEEVELVTFTGELRLSGMMASPTDALPLLTPQGPGRYGMRVQARGRPAGRQERPELPHPVRTTIRAADHRIRIVNPFQDTAPAPPLPDGLVAVAPDSLLIRTAKRAGPVGLHVNWQESAPRMTAGGWELTEEVEFVTTTGVMRVAGETLDLTPQGAGRYGLRVHGRHRDGDRLSNRPAESYLLVVWPVALG